MNILSNVSSNSSIKPCSEITYSKTSETQASSTDETMETVSISQKGKELSYDDLPVEAFALPDWFVNYIPEESMVSDELGSTCTQTNSNSPQLGRYNDKLFSFLKEELQNSGIDNAVDYYTSFLNNDEINEQVHQAVKERMHEDAQFMELADYYNITI